MLVSERIYQILKEKNISQIEFAKRTGISQSTVSDWKRKGTNPSADKIMIICDVLEVTPYDLLEGTSNQKMKEYEKASSPNYVVIDKDSPEYALVECYRNMDEEMKKRLEAYMKCVQ